MYAIVDIETTGGYAEKNKIVEIAIILHDGEKVTAEYETLINPERSIPMGISGIHGITNSMVEHAPKFYEVAKTIFELLDGKIFVAHNVNFDFGFIKKEFEWLGAQINLKKLCTVRLSRKLIQDMQSYSLGNLCQKLNIPIQNRHRACGDARATALLFDLLLKKDLDGFIASSLKKNSKEALLPAHLPKDVFDKLPEQTGVYYFLDEKGHVIYLGKAKNIKSRVASHFSGTATTWSRQNFKSKIFDIGYELTGNELIALLLESHEIKRWWPVYNRAQKYTTPTYGIFHYTDKKGYLRMVINRIKPGDASLLSFKNMGEARAFLTDKVKEFQLCPKLCGLQKAPKECFDFRLNGCLGACADAVTPEDYNKNFNAAIAGFKKENSSYAILGIGKTVDSRSIVIIENGVFLGFGYLPFDTAISNLEEAKSYIRPFKDNREVQSIIAGYLKKNKDKIVPFKVTGKEGHYIRG
ncbi:MAG: exonuclease domain-containing protein [Bacteroidota bacterium]|nr:exonuclease domain-containing protein [Bacteroidota bacterium]